MQEKEANNKRLKEHGVKTFFYGKPPRGGGASSHVNGGWSGITRDLNVHMEQKAVDELFMRTWTQGGKEVFLRTTQPKTGGESTVSLQDTRKKSKF